MNFRNSNYYAAQDAASAGKNKPVPPSPIFPQHPSIMEPELLQKQYHALQMAQFEIQQQLAFYQQQQQPQQQWPPIQSGYFSNSDPVTSGAPIYYDAAQSMPMFHVPPVGGVLPRFSQPAEFPQNYGTGNTRRPPNSQRNQARPPYNQSRDHSHQNQPRPYNSQRQQFGQQQYGQQAPYPQRVKVPQVPQQCVPCSVSFPNEACLANHLRHHVSCSVCGFSASKKLVMDHEKIVHNSAPFMASLSKITEQNASEQVPHTCTACSITFPNQACLNNHLGQHVVCSVCGFSASKKLISEHEKTMHSVAPFMQDVSSISDAETRRYVEERKKRYPSSIPPTNTKKVKVSAAEIAPSPVATHAGDALIDYDSQPDENDENNSPPEELNAKDEKALKSEHSKIPCLFLLKCGQCMSPDCEFKHDLSGHERNSAAAATADPKKPEPVKKPSTKKERMRADRKTLMERLLDDEIQKERTLVYSTIALIMKCRRFVHESHASEDDSSDVSGGYSSDTESEKSDVETVLQEDAVDREQEAEISSAKSQDVSGLLEIPIQKESVAEDRPEIKASAVPEEEAQVTFEQEAVVFEQAKVDSPIEEVQVPTAEFEFTVKPEENAALPLEQTAATSIEGRASEALYLEETSELSTDFAAGPQTEAEGVDVTSVK